MNKSWVAVATCVLLAVGCEQKAVQPEVQEVTTYPASTFFQTTRFFSARDSRNAFSAKSGDLLISSDETGIFNAYRVDVKSGVRAPLTSSTDSGVYAVGWFPSDNRFLYTQDGNGDELTHVFVQTASGEAIDLTPGEQVKAGFMGWSADNTAFFVFTNERDSAAFDVYRYSADDYQRQLIYTNSEGLELNDVTTDGHKKQVGWGGVAVNTHRERRLITAKAHL